MEKQFMASYCSWYCTDKRLKHNPRLSVKWPIWSSWSIYMRVKLLVWDTSWVQLGWTLEMKSYAILCPQYASQQISGMSGKGTFIMTWCPIFLKWCTMDTSISPGYVGHRDVCLWSLSTCVHFHTLKICCLRVCLLITPNLCADWGPPFEAMKGLGTSFNSWS